MPATANLISLTPIHVPSTIHTRSSSDISALCPTWITLQYAINRTNIQDLLQRSICSTLDSNHFPVRHHLDQPCRIFMRFHSMLMLNYFPIRHHLDQSCKIFRGLRHLQEFRQYAPFQSLSCHTTHTRSCILDSQAFMITACHGDV